MAKAAVAIMGVGTSNVSGITIAARARINQKAQMLLGGLTLSLGVMQYGTMLIERDDIAIRQLIFTLLSGGNISLGNGKF